MLCLTLMTAVSCSTTKKMTSQADQIIGKWVVDIMKIGEMEIPASVLEGQITLEFREDQTATFSAPDEGSETTRYEVRDSKIFDLDSPDDPPLEIVSLNQEEMVLAIEEAEGRIEMYLKRAKK